MLWSFERPAPIPAKAAGLMNFSANAGNGNNTYGQAFNLTYA